MAVYAELASEFPIAGGAYQWSRRLIGGAYGWFSGLGGHLRVRWWPTRRSPTSARPGRSPCSASRPTPATRSWPTGMVLVVVCALAGALGIDVLGRAVKAGHRRRGARLGGHRAGAAARVPRAGPRRSSPRRSAPRRCRAARCSRALLAALAVGGWVFIGFDACVGASEETRERRAPRAARDLDRAAERGGARDPQRGGGHAGPSRPGGGRGRRGHRPGHHRRSSPRSARGRTSRSRRWCWWPSWPAGWRPRRSPRASIYSIARDGVLPGVALPAPGGPPRRRRSAAIVVTAVVACLGLLLGLDSAAVGSLIAFGTAAIYVAFLLDGARRARGACARHLGAGGRGAGSGARGWS